MARVCEREVCGADLDELGKRPHARFCSGRCRAIASRDRRQTPGSTTKAQRKRTRPRKRGPRPGVTVYFPTVDAARAALGALDPGKQLVRYDPAKYPDWHPHPGRLAAAQAISRALQRRTARRRR